MFPDREPWIIDREGFTHHIDVGVDGTPNRLICNRKEMYQLLGDYYKVRDRQRIFVVKYSFKEYLVKLQTVENHIHESVIVKDRRSEENMQRSNIGGQQQHQVFSLQQSRETEVIQEETPGQQMRNNNSIIEEKMNLEREKAIQEIIEQIYEQQQQEIRIKGVTQEVEEITPGEYNVGSRRKNRDRSAERVTSKVVQKEIDRSDRKERKAKMNDAQKTQEQAQQESILKRDLLRMKPFMIDEIIPDDQLTHEDGIYRILFDKELYQAMEEVHQTAIFRGEEKISNRTYMFEEMGIRENKYILKTPLAIKWRGCILDVSQMLGKLVYRELPIREQLKYDIAMVWFVNRVIVRKEDSEIDHDIKKNITYLRDRHGTDTWALWLMKVEEDMEEKLQQEKWIKKMKIKLLDEEQMQGLVKQYEKDIADKGSGGFLYKDTNAFFLLSNITLYAWRKIGEEEFQFRLLVWRVRTRVNLQKKYIVIEKDIEALEDFLSAFNLYPWCNMIAQPKYDGAVPDRISKEVFPSFLYFVALITRIENRYQRYNFSKIVRYKETLEAWAITDQQLVQKYKGVQHYNGN